MPLAIDDGSPADGTQRIVFLWLLLNGSNQDSGVFSILQVFFGDFPRLLLFP